MYSFVGLVREPSRASLLLTTVITIIIIIARSFRQNAKHRFVIRSVPRPYSSDATFPKYAVRAFGCDAPFGSIYAINPAIIIVGVPLVAAATPRVRHFDMIFGGAWITALSPFVVAASQTYAGACLFVVTLSLGEMIWSPR